MKRRHIARTLFVIVFTLLLSPGLYGCAGAPGKTAGQKASGPSAASGGNANWLDAAAKSFAGGDGAIDNPYQIKTAEQLARMAQMVSTQSSNRQFWDKYYVLMADINLAGREWTPIGLAFAAPGGMLQEAPFAGLFDGRGHTISGLTIHTRAGYDYARLFKAASPLGKGDEFGHAGLFGVIAPGGMVDKVILRDVNIDTSANHVGALAGTNGGIIGDCRASGRVSGGLAYVGGLAGVNVNGEIVDSSADCAVSGERGVGGLVGLNRGELFRCKASGPVKGALETGALVGKNEGAIEE